MGKPRVCDHRGAIGSQGRHGKSIAGFLLTAYARRDRRYSAAGFAKGVKHTRTSDGRSRMILLKQKDGSISSYTNKGPCSSQCPKTCGEHNHRFYDGSTRMKHRGPYKSKCTGTRHQAPKSPDEGAAQHQSMPGKVPPRTPKSNADEQRPDTQPSSGKMHELMKVGVSGLGEGRCLSLWSDRDSASAYANSNSFLSVELVYHATAVFQCWLRLLCVGVCMHRASACSSEAPGPAAASVEVAAAAAAAAALLLLFAPAAFAFCILPPVLLLVLLVDVVVVAAVPARRLLLRRFRLWVRRGGRGGGCSRAPLTWTAEV